MSIRLSGDTKIESTDGSNISSTAALSSGTRTYEYVCTNTSFYIKIEEITKTHSSDLFDNAGLTDNANIWLQPADSVFLTTKIRLDTQFAAVGMTDLDVTLGDGGDNTGILNPAAMNLTSDAATTEYKDRGAYWNTIGGYYAASATQWIGYATAVGANLSTTSAGQITFYVYYLEV